MKRKLLAALLCAAMSLGMLAGCGSSDSGGAQTEAEKRDGCRRR